MSFLAFHADAIKAFLGKFWGGKVKDENGTLKDTGVQEFVEEFIARLQSQGPITLNKPLEFLNNTNGPAIKIFNNGPLADWHGIRLKDKEGNEAQFGIGLGNEGINANSFIPDPRYAIEPDDIQRFHSDLGGNAGADREHPKAIEAGNGLLYPTGLINNFQPALWLQNLLKNPQYESDTCHSRYRVDWFGNPAYLPTYVPQSRLIRATADEDIDKDQSGSVTDGEMESYTAVNELFLCIAQGDKVVLACIDDAYYIIATEEKPLFATGTTVDPIAKGGTGTVLLDSGESVEATSPYDSLTCNVSVALNRAKPCDAWTVTSAECWSEDGC